MASRDPEGEDAAGAGVDAADGETSKLLEAERNYDDPVLDVDPLPVSFEKAAERHTERPAQQYKGGVYDRALVRQGAIDKAIDGVFSSLSYGQTRNIVRKLATGFRALGVDDTDRIGIFSGPRMEWAQSDLALLATGATVTTVYERSSSRQVRYLLDDSGATGVVVENGELLDRVLEVADDLDLRFVASIDYLGPEYADREGVYTLADVFREGAKRYAPETYRSWLEEIHADDLATLVYTAGTTGRPKGVKLTHRNLRSNVNQLYRRVAPRPDRPSGAGTIAPGDTLLSYLSLAYAFERTVGHFLPLSVGATVAYAESADTLVEDFGTVRPTVSTGVPRVYERLYDRLRERTAQTEVAGLQVGDRLFEWAVDVGRSFRASEDPGSFLAMRHSLADRLVYDDVRERLGGNLEMLISGGGTLPPGLVRGFRAMGVPLVEGYGLTEASPVVSINPPEAVETGTVGVPLADVDVRVDPTGVPEDRVGGDEGEVGELLAAGPNVTDGYWNRPEATNQAFEGGYFRTGDVVRRRPDGYLAFRGRLRQMVVLSTGMDVAPGPIEDALTDRPTIEQAMVIGDGRRFTAALLVPDFPRLREAANEEGVSVPDDRAEMCTDPNVRAAVERDVEAVNEEFEDHERVKEFGLVPEAWTAEDGLLTASGQKRRQAILGKYDHLVEDVYAGAGPAETASPSGSPE